MRPTIFIDSSGGAEFVALSTLETDETREVGGVTYGVQHIEISSASHPFYTGKQVLLDTARRAEKFAERAAKMASTAATRKGKKAKRVKAEAKRAKTATKKSKKVDASPAETAA